LIEEIAVAGYCSFHCRAAGEVAEDGVESVRANEAKPVEETEAEATVRVCATAVGAQLKVMNKMEKKMIVRCRDKAELLWGDRQGRRSKFEMGDTALPIGLETRKPLTRSGS
jgi:hypothetical protein